MVHYSVQAVDDECLNEGGKGHHTRTRPHLGLNRRHTTQAGYLGTCLLPGKVGRRYVLCVYGPDS